MKVLSYKNFLISDLKILNMSEISNNFDNFDTLLSFSDRSLEKFPGINLVLFCQQRLSLLNVSRHSDSKTNFRMCTLVS